MSDSKQEKRQAKLEAKAIKKTEKAIKKHLRGKAIAGLIIGLIFGIIFGFGGYYIFSKDGEPEFYLLGENVIILEEGSDYSDPLYVAKLNNENLEVIVKGSVDTSVSGTYVISYTISDTSFFNVNPYEITLERIIIVRGNE